MITPRPGAIENFVHLSYSRTDAVEIVKLTDEVAALSPGDFHRLQGLLRECLKLQSHPNRACQADRLQIDAQANQLSLQTLTQSAIFAQNNRDSLEVFSTLSYRVAAGAHLDPQIANVLPGFTDDDIWVEWEPSGIVAYSVPTSRLRRQAREGGPFSLVPQQTAYALARHRFDVPRFHQAREAFTRRFNTINHNGLIASHVFAAMKVNCDPNFQRMPIIRGLRRDIPGIDVLRELLF